MKKLVFILVTSIALFSCKDKDNHWEMNLNVKEDLGMSNLSGVEVKLQGKKLSSGVYSDVWTDITSGVTDGSGNANLHFERDSYASLQLEVTRSQYFTEIVTLNPDDFKVGEVLQRQTIMTPMSSVLVYLKTTDASAIIDLQVFSNHPQCNCDDMGVFHVDGLEELSKTCYAPGGRYLKYQIDSNGPSGPLQYFDSLYIEPFVQNTLDYIY